MFFSLFPKLFSSSLFENATGVFKKCVSIWLFYGIFFYQDRDLGDEYGWKQVHGDVFRPSSHPLIFSSLIGSGCQIFSVSLIVIIVAMVEDLYTE